MEFGTMQFSNFIAAGEPAINLWWLVILLAIVLLIESVAIFAIAFKKKRKNGQTKTYVSVLPALLIGAALMPKSAVVVCATLGALIAVAAIVIAVVSILKKKSAKAKEEPVSTEEAPKPVADQTATILNQETVGETPEESKPETVEQQHVEEQQPAEEAVEERQHIAEQTQEEQAAKAPVEEEKTVSKEGPAVAVVTAEKPEENADESSVDDLTEFMETGEASGRAYDSRRKVFVLVRYDRSYTSRLIQSDDKTKSYYDEIKGELMSYKGVKSRISWRHENFRIGRERVAKLQFRGKKICLYLPLDPNDYVDSKYKIEDFSDVVKNKEVPLAYLIKNDLRIRYAKELIATVMARFGAEKLDGEAETYSQEYPYETLEELIGRKLIKVLMTNEEYEDAAADMAEEQPVEQSKEPVEEVAEPILPEEIVEEVAPETAHKLLSDERAEHLIVESTRYADPTRKGFVNVDVLSRNFKAGEVVTLDEIKKRVKGFDKRMTYVKVLARGILDKPLIVEGDDFSIDAAKMILLTGGKVLRTKRK